MASEYIYVYVVVGCDEDTEEAEDVFGIYRTEAAALASIAKHEAECVEEELTPMTCRVLRRELYS